MKPIRRNQSPFQFNQSVIQVTKVLGEFDSPHLFSAMPLVL